MLNEIYEYEQYTTPVSEYTDKFSSNKRIIRDQIQDGMGIKRALTIIARHYIFSEKNESSLFNNIDLEIFKGTTDTEEYSQMVSASMQKFNDDLHEVKSYLLKWCGRSNKSDLRDSWLRDYCINILHYSPDHKHYQSLVKVINNNIDYLNMSIKSKSTKNYNDRLSLDNIISNALDKGPLNRWYLVASNTDKIKSENDIFENIYAVSKDTLTANESGKIYNRITLNQKENVDNILKIASAYLINKQYSHKKIDNNEDLEYVWVTGHDLKMWGVSKVNTKIKNNKFCLKDKEPLFPRFNNVKHDILISINKDWFDKCGWCLMTENQLDIFKSKKKNQNIIFYSDQGKLLRTNKRY